MTRYVVINGSHRSAGNTDEAIKILGDELPLDVVHLHEYTIGHYEYDHAHKADDFLPLMRRLVQDYDCYIFATPVYWYSMSGRLKVFLDRLTDCMQIDQYLGRALEGKRMAALSCGSDNFFVKGFFQPFVHTAGYLKMSYLADVHTWANGRYIEPVAQQRIRKFAQILQS